MAIEANSFDTLLLDVGEGLAAPCPFYRAEALWHFKRLGSGSLEAGNDHVVHTSIRRLPSIAPAGMFNAGQMVWTPARLGLTHPSI